MLVSMAVAVHTDADIHVDEVHVVFMDVVDFESSIGIVVSVRIAVHID
mgnify:FL=1